ncbi:hypothetical protein BKA70DRAFT_1253224, partial [Coprinopsis sp. MPI-PUGE-AT-0042]
MNRSTKDHCLLRLEQIRNEIDKAECNNELAPIRRVSDDLLREIFVRCLPSPGTFDSIPGIIYATTFCLPGLNGARDPQYGCNTDQFPLTTSPTLRHVNSPVLRYVTFLQKPSTPVYQHFATVLYCGALQYRDPTSTALNAAISIPLAAAHSLYGSSVCVPPHGRRGRWLLQAGVFGANQQDSIRALDSITSFTISYWGTASGNVSHPDMWWECGIPSVRAFRIIAFEFEFEEAAEGEGFRFSSFIGKLESMKKIQTLSLVVARLDRSTCKTVLKCFPQLTTLDLETCDQIWSNHDGGVKRTSAYDESYSTPGNNGSCMSANHCQVFYGNLRKEGVEVVLHYKEKVRDHKDIQDWSRGQGKFLITTMKGDSL